MPADNATPEFPNASEDLMLSDAVLSGKESVTHFNGICPFCCESDFDLVGLKRHLLIGDCAEFNETKDSMMKLF